MQLHSWVSLIKSKSWHIAHGLSAMVLFAWAQSLLAASDLVLPSRASITDTDDNNPAKLGYVDQLIEGAQDEPTLADLKYISAEEHTLKNGYQGLSINNNFDYSSEVTRYRLKLNAVKETLNYGEWHFSGEFERADKLVPNAFFDNSNELSVSSNNQQGTGGNYSLSQNRFPLWGNYLADNTLGIIRTRQPSIFRGEYYVSIPTQDIKGIISSAYDNRNNIRLTFGQPGKFDPVRNFKPSEDRLFGLSFSRMLTPKLQLGVQFWQEDISSLLDQIGLESDGSQTVGLALEYQRNQKNIVKLLVVGSQLELKAPSGSKEKASLGISISNRFKRGLYTHHFGAYQLGHHLRWAGKNIPANKRGLYYLLGFTTPRFGLNTNLSLHENNYDTSGLQSRNQAPEKRLNIKQSLSIRLGPSSSIGTSVSIDTVDINHRRKFNWRSFFNHTYMNGHTGRIQLTLIDNNDDLSQSSEEKKLSYSHEWGLAILNLSAEVAYDQQLDQKSQIISRGYGIGFGLEREFDEGSFYLTSNYNQNISGITDQSSLGMDIGMEWNFSSHWTMGLSANYSRNIENDMGITNTLADRDENLISLTLNYISSSGRPYVTQGRGNRRGAAKILGLVFFDENNDGVRQSSEKAAKGITIVLDGGVVTRTSSMGLFDFSLVKPGQHVVAVEIEGVPLPWGIRLSDEQQIVDVSARSGVQLKIPLQSLN